MELDTHNKGKASPVGRINMRAYRQAAKFEAKRRARMTPEERAAEDKQRDQAWDVAIKQAEVQRAQALATSGAVADVHSVAELIEQAKQQPVCAANEVHWKFWRDKGYDTWYGLDAPSTFKTVEALAITGWTKGLARIEAEMTDIAEGIQPPQSMKRRRVWTDQGDSLDIHRVNSGMLGTAWQRTARRNVSARVDVKIVISSIIYTSQSADLLFYRGAAAVVLADLLTDAGYNVSVWTAFTGETDTGEAVACKVCIKPSTAPLDKAALAVAAMPAFFRCIGHRWITAHTKREQRNNGIQPSNYRAVDSEISDTHTIYDRESARRWVVAQLAKLEEQAA